MTATKRIRGLLISGVVLAALLVALRLPPVHWRVVGWWRGEAFFQGRPSSYWLARWHWLNRERSRPEQWARKYFGDGCGDVIWGDQSPPKFDSTAVPVLIELLNDSSPQVRARAAYELGQMSVDARPAVPALRRLLGDRNGPSGSTVGDYAASAIRRIESGPNDDPDRPLRIVLSYIQIVSDVVKEAERQKTLEPPRKADEP
jgi:hypothetical protein